jgi:tetratricopeptide (TPR) repeat protein
MFLQAAESYKNGFSYLNLGRACYQLGHLQEAEKVLGIANMLDSTRAETWGLLTLVLLRKEEPEYNAAYQTMNEAFKLGLSNLEILKEISFLNLTKLQYKTAREALEYEMVVQAGPKN